MSAAAVVSIKTPVGLVVGDASHVDHDGILVEVENRLTQGEHYEFRLELPQADDTILGTLTVRRCNSSSLQAHIVEISAGDRECFEAWWREMAKGHAVFHPRITLTSADLGPSAMHGATDSETNSALAGMDARRTRMQARFAEDDWRDEDTEEIFVHGSVDEILSPSAEGKQVASPQRRAATRTIFQPAPPPPQDLSAPPPVRQSARAAQRSTTPAAPVAVGPQDEVVAADPGTPDLPAVHLVSAQDHAIMVVRWPKPGAFLASLTQGLASGFLQLPRGALDHWPRLATVHLHSPGGLELAAFGMHLTDQDDHVLYRLELDPCELEELQAEAMAG